jgi:LmbE family N-acetylglucosaminyl deacetylase
MRPARQAARLGSRRGGPRTSPVGVRTGRLLPAWSKVLVVVAHPDDETFGLGAIVDRQACDGVAVHVLCYTRGGASTLNETGADLDQARGDELRRASAELGAATVTLLDYPDGHLAGVGTARLAAHVANLIARHRPEGLLVFDDTGITGHPDHRAATRAAVSAAADARRPVLGWALPATVAGRLHAETGLAFAGQPPDRIDLCVRVNRARQRRAALLHASQISPTAVLWRRLQLQGDCEHLRWLRPPQPASARHEPAPRKETPDDH